MSPDVNSGSVVLHAENMYARYGRVVVTRDVSLSVEAGQVLALLGLNGAGKTSLVQAIAGFVKSSGTVSLNGQSIERLPSYRRSRAGLALVPEGRALFGALSVAENLELGARLAGVEDGSTIDRAVALFPRLKERWESHASTLSGGEQQMLAIARALASDPSVVILDEPTQGLAPFVHDLLIEGIKTLRSEGLAVVLVEQNLGFATRVADRFTILHSGAITASGDRSDLSDRDAVRAAYLGHTSPHLAESTST